MATATMPNTYSASINGQLVSVLPANTVSPPGAPAPLVSQGSSPSTLPGGIQGGAVSSSATGGQTAGGSAPGGSAATLSALSANVWSLPIWQNPLFLILAALGVGLLFMHAIHWRH